ncbi:PspA/IM30 family protein [Synechococcus sp. H60.3]|uniref:PspA/IM30 family protein n=1 Tax=unclassified Synechococcus TaxID=2626047 RepID=UPI0039C3B459
MGVRKIIYGIFGQRAGSVIVGTWNWLWGIPVDKGGTGAVMVAEESLRAMQETVQRLTEAVATQVAAYQRAEQKYMQKVREYQALENKARLAMQRGDQEAARLAMAEALRIEAVLGPLKENVETAERYVTAAKQKLAREKERLAAYKSELSNLKDINEVNQALEQMTRVNNAYNIDSAKSQFEAAKNAIQARQLKTRAMSELSEDRSEQLAAQLDEMAMDDEVSRRLAMLTGQGGSSANLPLPDLDFEKRLPQ